MSDVLGWLASAWQFVTLWLGIGCEVALAWACLRSLALRRALRLQGKQGPWGLRP